jgi:phosphohistidine phosphatase
MRTLYLIRHGKAEDKGGIADIKRNLEFEGREEVKRTAEKLLAKHIKPSLIISSPANRAYQTAEIVGEKLGYIIADILIEKDIYYTNEEALLETIYRQDDTHESILLAGHNPSITHLAGMLTQEYKDFIPTGGLVAFKIDSESWNDFNKSKVSFLFSIYP